MEDDVIDLVRHRGNGKLMVGDVSQIGFDQTWRLESWERRDWVWAKSQREQTQQAALLAGGGLVLGLVGVLAGASADSDDERAGAALMTLVGVGSIVASPFAFATVGIRSFRTRDKALDAETLVVFAAKADQPYGSVATDFVYTFRPERDFSGSVFVEVSQTIDDWSADAFLEFDRGQILDISALPYAPGSPGRRRVTFEPSSLRFGRTFQAADTYEYLLASGLGLGNPSGRLADTYREWTQPHFLEFELRGFVVESQNAEQSSDHFSCGEFIKDSKPELYAMFVRNEAILGRTDPKFATVKVGRNHTTASFRRREGFALSVRKTDTFEVRLLDQDSNLWAHCPDDLLARHSALGIPTNAKFPSLLVEVRPAHDWRDSETLRSCKDIAAEARSDSLVFAAQVAGAGLAAGWIVASPARKGAVVRSVLSCAGSVSLEALMLEVSHRLSRSVGPPELAEWVAQMMSTLLFNHLLGNPESLGHIRALGMDAFADAIEAVLIGSTSEHSTSEQRDMFSGLAACIASEMFNDTLWEAADSSHP